MVKHGRNKKRRAGRIGRTKIKNNSWTTWNPKPKINDPTVKKLWDVKKSPNQNLASMGLSTNVNKEDENKDSNANTATTTTTTDKNRPNVVELFDIPDSDAHHITRRVPLQKDEQEFIIHCLEKYGTDYTKMFRDTKLNYLQHTETKLRKMGARFLLLNPQQILVDEIPDNVQDMMTTTTTNGNTNNDPNKHSAMEKEQDEEEESACSDSESSE